MNLDEVGWFRMDATLKSQHGRREDDKPGEAVRPWRLAVLDSRFRTLQEALPLSLSGHPVPQPGWSDVAAKVGDDWRDAVLVAHEQDTTVAEVLRATRGLRIAHPRLAGPAVVGDGDLDWKPEFTDWYVMKGLLGSKRDPLESLKVNVWGRPLPRERRTSHEIHYQHPPGDLSGVVRASAQARLPLGELAEACIRYAPFVRKPWNAVPDHHRDHVCTDAELRLLYLHEDEHRWRPAVHPWDVPSVAAATGLDVGEVQRRMAAFAWLGRPAPDPVLAARWAGVPSEISTVMRHYIVPGSAGRPELLWGAAIELAAECELTVWEAERALTRAADGVAVVHRRRYAKRSPGRDTVLSPDTGHLVRRLHGEGIRLEDGVSLRDLAFVRSHETPFGELACCLDELREAGVDLPDAASLLRAWDDLPTPSRYAFSGEDPSWVGADYPVPATSAVLFTGSQRLRQKLYVLWDLARQEAHHLGLSAALVAPAPPEELREFIPTWDEMAALVDVGPDEDVDYEWFETPRWVPLTAQRLVGYARARAIGARTAYRALTPFRTIGALVPELTAEAEAALPDEVPGAHDAVAVDPAYRVSEPGTRLVPLDLVSIAGRLGESVRHTWHQRVSPYLALEETPSSITDVPDVVPGWQDLAILSESHDGKLPALTGHVGRDRVERCARVVEETPEWVRRRLEIYAGMFAFRLADTVDRGDRP
ncbi:wHTH domain-containing protein [Streptomyces sp. NPDC054787]